ncbi:hypothetical protein AXF42_Ash012528 [Apostasia shenzhenica]|uniref:Uncharacterized protein n=1 Tax=Apostasia shenzhenica TaxID=1088818 RepID=A0A2I0AR14_9ASPA|nr:hypothetical protein AXF42_Ash012528 [Apostasia shenzhenica]
MSFEKRDPTIMDALTLSPLPYPVLLILAVVLLLLGLSWSFSFQDFVEKAGKQTNWALIFSPLALLLVIRWISSADSLFDAGGILGFLFPGGQYIHRRISHAGERHQDGAPSPWGVAAFVVVVLLLISFHPSLRDFWGP